MSLNDLPNIGRVLAYYGATITREFGNYSIKCPFHDDKHASAGVNHRENLFNCLACGEGGNSLQIIARQEGVSVREAIAIAERITGESVRELSSEREFGSSLPKRKGHNKSSSAIGSIRRSREP